jgi:hypothetical protein
MFHYMQCCFTAQAALLNIHAALLTHPALPPVVTWCRCGHTHDVSQLQHATHLSKIGAACALSCTSTVKKGERGTWNAGTRLKRTPFIRVPLRVIVHNLANAVCCDVFTILLGLWLRQAPQHLVRNLTQFQPTSAQQRPRHLQKIDYKLQFTAIVVISKYIGGGSRKSMEQ